ncbi:MAG: restriction endonuclease subunit S [Roseburia sp.]|nr:restriction endonuclease subunit S [Roseburia sp.]
MKYKNLADLSISHKGFYGIGASACQYSSDLPQYLRITDISDDGRIPLILPTSINTATYPDYHKYFLASNDMVFARTGNSTGRNYLFTGKPNTVVYAGFLIKFSIDENIINPKYVKYYCQSSPYKHQIESLVTGSTRNNLNAEQYAMLQIPIVDSCLQQHIVDITPKGALC